MPQTGIWQGQEIQVFSILVKVPVCRLDRAVGSPVMP